jgi:glutathionyl-hydroquinone reductase
LVYRPIFRACLKRFSDYPALSRWLERILALPNVAATVRSDEILAHYDDGWAPRCPSIVPLQPAARACLSLEALTRQAGCPGSPACRAECRCGAGSRRRS